MSRLDGVGAPADTVGTGAPVDRAEGAIVLVHGRGATAGEIVTLGPEIADPERAHFVAPQAPGRTWYPYRFLEPLEANEPALSRSLGQLEETISSLTAVGIGPGRILLAGFSQGACLALEFASRHPSSCGAVVAWTGGLIGPPGASWERREAFPSTPIYLGAGDPDPHVPWWRVEESARALERQGAEVVVERFPGLGHGIDPRELTAAREIWARLVQSGAAAP